MLDSVSHGAAVDPKRVTQNKAILYGTASSGEHSESDIPNLKQRPALGRRSRAADRLRWGKSLQIILSDYRTGTDVRGDFDDNDGRNHRRRKCGKGIRQFLEIHATRIRLFGSPAAIFAAFQLDLNNSCLKFQEANPNWRGRLRRRTAKTLPSFFAFDVASFRRADTYKAIFRPFPGKNAALQR